MRAVVLGLGFGLVALPSIVAGNIVGNPQVLVHANGNPAEVFLDLDGDGHSDIRMFAGGATFVAVASVGAASGSDLMFTESVLALGSQVDSSQTFVRSPVSIMAQYSVTDPLLDKPGGTIEGDYGFRFTSGGATHYGWADITVSAQILPNGYSPAFAYVHQWWYESEPNTPITVGAVPEPASAALLLVGAPILLRGRR